MQRETILTGGMVLLLVAMLATPLVVPGVLDEPDENIRPSHLHLQTEDSTIDVTSVPGRTANLQLDTRLVHRGGPARNVTMEVRAIDDDSGLLEDQVRQSVGTITEERTVSVLTNLSVEREGDYRIETIVYEDGNRVERGTRTIRNVQALQPDYADSTIQFERYENSPADIPTITVDPETTAENRSRLSVTAALTNGGDTSAGDVTLRLRARQTESNVIADQAQQEIGSIGPGRTVEPNATLTVPDGYNYYIDAILLSDGVVVDTTIGVANLDPTRAVEANETREEIEFDTGDFADEPTTPEPDRPEPEATTVGSGPGFGVGVALVALLATALLTARRHSPTPPSPRATPRTTHPSRATKPTRATRPASE